MGRTPAHHCRRRSILTCRFSHLYGFPTFRNFSKSRFRTLLPPPFCRYSSKGLTTRKTESQPNQSAPAFQKVGENSKILFETSQKALKLVLQYSFTKIQELVPILLVFGNFPYF